MDIEIRPEDQAFAGEVQRWLDEHLVGEFAAHRGVGGPDDSAAWDVRLRWEKELSAGRWLGLTWPPEYGGRGATLARRSSSSTSTPAPRRPIGSASRARTCSAPRC